MSFSIFWLRIRIFSDYLCVEFRTRCAFARELAGLRPAGGDMQAPENFFEFDGDVLVRNNVKEIGGGEKVLMLAHGFGCDQNMWRCSAIAAAG